MNENHPTQDIEEEQEEKKSLLPAIKGERSLVPRDALSAYLQEIRNIEGLSEEEERQLAIKYREKGDVKAAYKLTTSHLMLVVKIAMTFRREWQSMMDLIQEGNVGLMKAVKNYDPFRGVRLSSYATWWIRSYILKYLLDNWRLVRVGTTNARRKLLFNLKREKEKLAREGFDPSTKLLAEHFGVDESEIIDVEASIGASDVSLDAPLHDNTTATPAHLLTDGGHSPEKQAEAKQFSQSLKAKIEQFTKDLKPIEVEIMDQRVLSEDPRSLQEIGDDYQITREAVRQAEQRMLKKFKTYIEEHMPEAADYFKS